MSTESVLAVWTASIKSHIQRPVHVIANDLTPLNRKLLRAGSLDFVLQQEFSVRRSMKPSWHSTIFIMHDRKPRSQIKYVSTSVITPEMV